MRYLDLSSNKFKTLLRPLNYNAAGMRGGWDAGMLPIAISLEPHLNPGILGSWNPVVLSLTAYRPRGIDIQRILKEMLYPNNHDSK